MNYEIAYNSSLCSLMRNCR